MLTELAALLALLALLLGTLLLVSPGTPAPFLDAARKLLPGSVSERIFPGYTHSEKVTLWRAKSGSGISVAWNETVATDPRKRARLARRRGNRRSADHRPGLGPPHPARSTRRINAARSNERPMARCTGTNGLCLRGRQEHIPQPGGPKAPLAPDERCGAKVLRARSRRRPDR